MRQLLVISMLLITGIVHAQRIAEPDFIGQVFVVNADSTTTLLQKETAEMKTKTTALGYIPLPGASLLDKGKTYLFVRGISSLNKLPAGHITLIVRTQDNNVEPKTAFGVFKFERKKKERRFVLAEVGTFSMKATTSFNTVPCSVRKFGNNSYMVRLDNLEAGEYGIVTTDFNNITTFSVE